MPASSHSSTCLRMMADWSGGNHLLRGATGHRVTRSVSVRNPGGGSVPLKSWVQGLGSPWLHDPASCSGHIVAFEKQSPP